jgi:peptidoglycan/LPS O-acetylase OafA/YrhL
MWSLERKPHILDFYIRRIFRIYPLAIASILVLVVLHIPTMQNINGDTYFQMPGLKVFTANILLIQNVLGGSNVIGVLWTLPLEIQMYFLLPFLFFYPAELRGLASPTPMTVTVVYARSAFPVDSNSFVVCIPYFLSGVIAYVLFGKVRPRLPALLMPPLVLLMLCGFMFRPSWRNGWWLTLLLGITIPLFRPIRMRWLAASSHHLAKYSYGIYLIHPFCITIGINVLHNYNLVVRISAIVLSMVVIVVPTYHFLEKPMINLGARFAANLERQYELSVPAG